MRWWLALALLTRCALALPMGTYLGDLSKAKMKRIASGPCRATWSGDGGSLYLVPETTDLPPVIYRYNAEGSSQTMLLRDPLLVRVFIQAISADGRYLAVYVMRKAKGGTDDSWRIINARTGELVRVVEKGFVDDFDRSQHDTLLFSPDSKAVVWTANRSNGLSMTLHVMNIATADRVQLGDISLDSSLCFDSGSASVLVLSGKSLLRVPLQGPSGEFTVLSAQSDVESRWFIEMSWLGGEGGVWLFGQTVCDLSGSVRYKLASDEDRFDGICRESESSLLAWRAHTSTAVQFFRLRLAAGVTRTVLGELPAADSEHTPLSVAVEPRACRIALTVGS